MTPEEMEEEERLSKIEENAERDHTDIVALKRQVKLLREQLDAAFSAFREQSLTNDRQLMFFIEQVRAVATLILKNDPGQAEACNQIAYEQLVELQKKLHR